MQQVVLQTRKGVAWIYSRFVGLAKTSLLQLGLVSCPPPPTLCACLFVFQILQDGGKGRGGEISLLHMRKGSEAGVGKQWKGAVRFGRVPGCFGATIRDGASQSISTALPMHLHALSLGTQCSEDATSLWLHHTIAIYDHALQLLVSLHNNNSTTPLL